MVILDQYYWEWPSQFNVRTRKVSTDGRCLSMVSVHTVVLGQITQCNPCTQCPLTQCPLMGGVCLRKVENNSCFMSLTGKVTKLLSIYERAPLKEVPVFLCVQLSVQLSKVSAQGRLKKSSVFMWLGPWVSALLSKVSAQGRLKMQSLYVAGIMTKCPIKQDVCPSDIKHAAFAYGWEFA